MTERKNLRDWSGWPDLFLGISTLLLILANVSVVLEWFHWSRIAVWIINVVLVSLFLIIVGKAITGQLSGFLIDDRINRVSLSRFQLVLWTLVILPALLTILIFNLVNAPQAPDDSPVKNDPLNVQIPPEVLGLLGLSAVSLASSQYIKDRNVDQEVLEKAAEQNETGSTQGGVPDPSSPAPNSDPKKARFADMFTGETETSKGFLEIGKVQMFFFTLIVALGYAIAIGDDLGNTGLIVIEKMPDLTAGMLVLLGISQAGYIANKAVSYYSSPAADGATESDVEPRITNVYPNPVDFDQAKLIEITGINFGQDPNKPPKGIVFLDGRPLETEEWAPTQVKAKLPGSKTEAEKVFILPSSVEVVVQDYSGRRSPPAPDKVSLT